MSQSDKSNVDLPGEFATGGWEVKGGGGVGVGCGGGSDLSHCLGLFSVTKGHRATGRPRTAGAEPRGWGRGEIQK